MGGAPAGAGPEAYGGAIRQMSEVGWVVSRATAARISAHVRFTKHNVAFFPSFFGLLSLWFDCGFGVVDMACMDITKHLSRVGLRGGTRRLELWLITGEGPS